ncbi:hypothetical protein FLLO111716_03120 [Flavobacterium longum]
MSGVAKKSWLVFNAPMFSRLMYADCTPSQTVGGVVTAVLIVQLWLGPTPLSKIAH